MTPAKPVPGTVTVVPSKDGFSWKWTSPKGNEHLSPVKYPAEKAAMAEGRKFARRSATAAQYPDDEA